MHILFIADPLESFKIHKDTTFAMMEEANKRNHAIWFCEAGDLFVEGERVLTEARPVSLTGKGGKEWFKKGDAQRMTLQNFSAVIMRKDPPFDLEYLYATQLLTLAEAQGARVFNRGQALRDFNEKLAILNFPEQTAPTMVTSRPDRLKRFVRQHQDAILKPLDGMGGSGIFRVTPDDPNLNVIIETVSRQGTQTVMAQRYIPEIRDGDKRVLVIDGVPVDYCLARIPQGGETRGNLAAGGRGEARPLSERDREIAAALAPELKQRGILLAGLDVIGNYLTEVNVTSPTCFREIMDQAGINVAGLFIDALERACGHTA